MFFVIYETVNIINGKKYRGCHVTEDLDDGYLGSGVLFKKALKKYAKQEHHLKGKDPWNKGLKTGKKSWNSGLKIEKNITCPHCGKLGASMANMKRWHFDNCKKLNHK